MLWHCQVSLDTDKGDGLAALSSLWELSGLLHCSDSAAYCHRSAFLLTNLIHPFYASQDKEERERREREAQRKRQQWRALSAAEKKLDWQRYGKYDALHQLLQSAAEEPTFEVRSLNQRQAGDAITVL